MRHRRRARPRHCGCCLPPLTIHGVPYDNDYAFVFRLRDGKISEVIEYLDTAMVETAAYGKKIA